METQTAHAPTVDLEWDLVARDVLRSRLLDDLEEAELAPSGEVPYQFSARGHELGQVLLAHHLKQTHDAATVYYRSRPFLLSVGLSLTEALAAGMGKVGSPSKGRDVGVVFSLPPRRGVTVLPASGDVGAQYTPAAGWAQACLYYRDVLKDASWAGSLAVALGGDASVAANGFWSALTMATTLRLPLLFFIEDNGYGLSVPGRLQTPGGNIAANLASFNGLAVLSGSGTDPDEAAELVGEAVAHVRHGRGPCLLRLLVPRLSGHTFVDNQAYKTDAERADEVRRDPLPGLENRVGGARWRAMRLEVEAELRAALEEARAQAVTDEPATRHVFFEGGASARVEAPAGGPDAPRRGAPPRRLNLIEAVRSVMEAELAANPRAVVFGEDVGAKGGVHGATAGLQARFGDRRVFDTSLSEEGILGRAIGLALAGLLPLPEIQFRKYADPATESINDAGTIRWRTAGVFSAPMVVRMPVGFGKKIGDPWHSVTAEAVFAHTLGWRIAYPSNAADAAGLFRTALRCQDPVLFLEHRSLLDAAIARRPDPGPDFALPFGLAGRLSQGGDLTLVTWGAMVHRALEAAEKFPGAVDLLDLRTICPWDRPGVLDSVRRTGRLLVVHEDTWTAGFAGEILATVAAEAFADLDAPPRRLATPDSPIPYNAELMRRVLPDVGQIADAIRDLLSF
jgi:2-oxoisovalerate dehydrogenase E1 component